MKKFISIFVALIFSTTIFSGCSNNQMATGGGGIVVIGGILGGVGTFLSGTSDIIKVIKDDAKTEVEKVEPNKPVEPKVEPVEKVAEDLNQKVEEEKNSSDIDESKQDKILTPPKQENKNTSAEPNIIYKRFTDKICGFSFEYPAEGDDKNLISENAPEQAKVPDGNAFNYSLQFDNSIVITGMDFAYIPATDDLNYVAKNLVDSIRSFNKEDMKITVEKLGEQVFLLTWINPEAKKDYSQKSFFGTNHYGRKEHHYVRYVYNIGTPDAEKKVAKHMIDSFRSGFEQ